MLTLQWVLAMSSGGQVNKLVPFWIWRVVSWYLCNRAWGQRLLITSSDATGAPAWPSADGKRLIVDFNRGNRPTDRGLQPGQCSWLDRGLRSNEPTWIIDERPTVGEAQSSAKLINRGDTWTFWVFNTRAGFLKATASSRGTPTQKPHNMDWRFDNSIKSSPPLPAHRILLPT